LLKITPLLSVNLPYTVATLKIARLLAIRQRWIAPDDIIARPDMLIITYVNVKKQFQLLFHGFQFGMYL
jgi:hypothetical protein